MPKEPDEKVAARRARVAEMTAAGFSAALIGHELGVDEMIVYSDRRHLGITHKASTSTQKGLSKTELWAQTAVRREKVKALSEAGMRPVQISRELGVSRFLVYCDRNALGLTVSSDQEGRIADRRESVAELVRRGATVEEIARKLDVNARTVMRDKKHLGLTGPPNQPLTDEELDICATMLDDGASYTEIARTIGRSVHVVAQRFPGRGWTPRQAAERRSLVRKYGWLLDGR